MADDELSYVEVDDEGLKRGGAVLANDGALTEEELDGVRQGWRALIEDRAHNGRTRYVMPNVRGMPPRNSFQLPRDVINALGDGDPRAGGFIAHQLFGVEDDPADPTRIHGDVVRLIGNGSLAAGRKVLEKFVSMVRRQSREGVILHYTGPQYDDDHGWSVGR